MNQNNEPELDNEYKRYLQILRRYLCQLLDQDVICLCNAWIKKLSDCKENEKTLRNKYVFVLCYQLAKGVLDEPFLQLPPSNELPPLRDDESINSSGTEAECLVMDCRHINNESLNDTQGPSQIFNYNSGIDVNKNNETSHSFCDSKISRERNNLHQKKCESSVQPYPFIDEDVTKYNEFDDNYHLRANKLIMNLREIKEQNKFLRNELVLMKEEAKRKHSIDNSFDDSISNIDNATMRLNSDQDRHTILTSLKKKLQEIQNSRNGLIETVSTLQDKLDNSNVMKMHEIEDIHAQHKLEMIELKTTIREEMKAIYDKKLDALKKEYEKLILDMQHTTREEIEIHHKNSEKVVNEKENLLQNKELEVNQLKHQLEEMRSHQFSVLNKFIDCSNENSAESVKMKSLELEKRLNKMERTKNKCIKAYQNKIASLQREKHLAECSLQLQLIKQRAQVVDELTEENQVRLATALDSLENKYKGIVANMQSTAFQRRIQDQIALDTLIQAVCGVANENPYINPTQANTGQFSGQTIRNQSKDKNLSRDKEIGTIRNSGRVDNALVEDKSFGEDSIGTGYCLDSDKVQELFERVHIPQRDLADLPK